MEVVTIYGFQIPVSTLETLMFGLEVSIVGIIGFAIGYTVAMAHSVTTEGVSDDM